MEKDSTEDLRPQNKEFIVSLGSKRIKDLDYLKRVHYGCVFWMNLIRITQDDILRFYGPENLLSRAHEYYSLGASIAPLLEYTDDVVFAASVLQALVEWEHYFTKESKRTAREFRFSEPTKSHTGGFAGILPKVALNRNFVYLERLVISFPFVNVDLAEVLASTCDILTKVYKRFLMMENFSTNDGVDVICKIDERLRASLFEVAAKDMQQLSKASIRLQLLTSLESFKIRDLEETQADLNEEEDAETPSSPELAPLDGVRSSSSVGDAITLSPSSDTFESGGTTGNGTAAEAIP